MRVIVFGATGDLGREVVRQALAQGHQVTAFVRNPKKLSTVHENLTLAEGRVLEDSDRVNAAVKGHDAVISVLGPGQSFKSGELMSRSVPAITQAMERHGVRRLVVTSGIVVKPDSLPAFGRLLVRLLMRDLAADKRAAEDFLRKTSVEWTIVYPVSLTSGPKTSKYVWGENVAFSGFPFPSVSRADVAHLITSCMSDESTIRKGLMVGGRGQHLSSATKTSTP